ncbi:MAG TPA: hypothetical protein VMV90_07865 [Rectinemataceae bacterium]|nr:hypothetical protein [Rectinemataceae bacterium]
MRKLLVIALLAALLIPVFADDGTVLPAGVFRARVIPAFGWIPGSYDKNGKYTALSTGTATIPNLGFSLEYGITDWVTLGLQWAPGITFASNIPMGTSTTYNMNGPSDLFAGVMVQIVGPKAPVVSDVIRFDLSPGVKIPLGGVDFSTQTGSTITLENPDKQTLGIGGRAYFDYVFSPSFFLDLYSQFIYYPTTVDAKYISYYDAVYNAGLKIGYGYDLRIELDPHYSMQLSDALTLSANCAFRYDATPDYTYSGTASYTTLHSSLFSANPSVALFFTKSVVPFELQLDYGQPLYGVSTPATYSLDLQAKVYFKL